MLLMDKRVVALALGLCAAAGPEESLARIVGGEDIACRPSAAGPVFSSLAGRIVSAGPPIELYAQPGHRQVAPVRLQAAKVSALRVNAALPEAVAVEIAKSIGLKVEVRSLFDPGAKVAMPLEIPAGSYADALTRLTAANGMRWSFDGKTVWLIGPKAWSVPLPGERDMALAAIDAVGQSPIDVRVVGGSVQLYGEFGVASQVATQIAQVSRQARLHPFEVKFYRVAAPDGTVHWDRLAARTDTVRQASLVGRAAGIVLEGDSAPLVELFLGSEGTVGEMGSATMVAGREGGRVSRILGCGSQGAPAQGLALSARSLGATRLALDWQMLGGLEDANGSAEIELGDTLIIASGRPVDGYFMVAVVRPRMVALSNASMIYPEPLQQPGPVVARSPADTMPVIQMVTLEPDPEPEPPVAMVSAPVVQPIAASLPPRTKRPKKAKAARTKAATVAIPVMVSRPMVQGMGSSSVSAVAVPLPTPSSTPLPAVKPVKAKKVKKVKKANSAPAAAAPVPMSPTFISRPVVQKTPGG